MLEIVRNWECKVAVEPSRALVALEGSVLDLAASYELLTPFRLERDCRVLGLPQDRHNRVGRALSMLDPSVSTMRAHAFERNKAGANQDLSNTAASRFVFNERRGEI